jgi:hypothetical protein
MFEYDTIQSYFDESKINRLLDKKLRLISDKLITTEIVGTTDYSRRHFLVAEKI